MLDEMKEKFEDSFTDEEKIQIFNLIFSGYYSLSYIKFLAQKKAGKDLGIEVKEPQNLLPPEGDGADYDDYLDAILQQPNKNSILENPNRPEDTTKAKEEVKDDINEDVRIEAPSIVIDPVEDEHVEVSHEEVEDSISKSPINSSPLEESTLSGNLPDTMEPNSSLGDIPEGFAPTRVDEAANNMEISENSEPTASEEITIQDGPVEEKEPLSPTVSTETEEVREKPSEEEKKENDVITFGFGDMAVGEAHAPTIEVIQEDTRPKKEEIGSSQIKIVAPDEVTNGNTDTATMPTEAVVLPTVTADVNASLAQETAPETSQPTIEVPTISIEDLTNPKSQTPTA